MIDENSSSDVPPPAGEDDADAGAGGTVPAEHDSGNEETSDVNRVEFEVLTSQPGPESGSPKVRYLALTAGPDPAETAEPDTGSSAVETELPEEPPTVDAETKEPPAATPEAERKVRRGLRFDPTIPTLILAVGVVLAGVFFVRDTFKPTATWEIDTLLTSGVVQSALQSGAQSEEEVLAAEEVAPPVIGSIWVASWNDDGLDHPELVSALTDGDPETLWYSRYYYQNEFSEETVISLMINLEQEAVVSEVNLDIIGAGGEILIREPEGENPRAGTILATATAEGNTSIKLAQPTKLSRIAINFQTLPVDDVGHNRIKVSGLSVH